jgi:hypothetical protein
VVAVIVVLAAIAGGIVYFVASRESATPKNDNQQARADNSPQPSLSPTPPVAQSPGVTPTASPAASPVNVKKIESLLRGQWQSQTATATDCECSSSGCLDIQFNKTIDNFCVESNQVYVTAFYRLDAANQKAYLFFRDPSPDLGAGGNRMPWDMLDRKKPLATIDLSDLEGQRVINVAWHGFTQTGAVKTQRWRQIGSAFQGAYLKR